jgi:hypothetical protein
VRDCIRCEQEHKPEEERGTFHSIKSDKANALR